MIKSKMEQAYITSRIFRDNIFFWGEGVVQCVGFRCCVFGMGHDDRAVVRVASGALVLCVCRLFLVECTQLHEEKAAA